MSKTLLAIDDSLTMRKVFEITFTGEDFNVVTAESGKAGLGKAGENPSVVLIDTSLDGEDGYAICKELRQKLPRAGLILLASRHNPYDANKGKDAGADDFADKPFDTQQLIDKVKKVVLGKETGAPASASVAVAAPASASVAAAPKSSGTAAAARSKTLVFGPEMIPAPVDPTKAPPKESEVKAAPAKAQAPATSPKPSGVAASSSVGSAVNGQLAAKLGDLGLSKEQVDAVLALSREVVERVVWEVVPNLAEAIIKEEIARLTK